MTAGKTAYKEDDMKFEVNTTKRWYNDISVTSNIDMLKDLGFKFDLRRNGKMLTDNGLVNYTEYTIGDERVFIDINTIEELLDFVKKYSDVIISLDEENPNIEIYNDYRE